MRNQARLPGLNHRLVLELDRGRVRELLLAVALSGLMLMPLLLYVWQSSEWIRTGYRIERLKNQRDKLVERNHQLRLEKTSLEGLARVERIASGQLGLAQPPGGTVVLIEMERLRPARPPSSRAEFRAAVMDQGGAPQDAAGDQAPN